MISHDTSLKVARITAIVGLGIFLAGTLSMIPISLAGQSTQELFNSYLRKKRILLVFFDREDGTNYRKQMEIVSKAQEQFDERDLVVMTLSPLTEGAEMLRNRYNPFHKSFMAVLIDKDGGMKLKAEHPMTAEAICGTIDSMQAAQEEELAAARGKKQKKVSGSTA